MDSSFTREDTKEERDVKSVFIREKLLQTNEKFTSELVHLCFYRWFI